MNPPRLFLPAEAMSAFIIRAALRRMSDDSSVRSAAPGGDRRRSRSTSRGGRRWNDDPDIAAEHEHVALLLGRALYELREWNDWSQEELAAAAGVHPDTVSGVERATGDPRLSTLIRLFFCVGHRVAVYVRRPSPATRRS
jgi:DNA-binding XRE family transcriptional regulator